MTGRVGAKGSTAVHRLPGGIKALAVMCVAVLQLAACAAPSGSGSYSDVEPARSSLRRADSAGPGSGAPGPGKGENLPSSPDAPPPNGGTGVSPLGVSGEFELAFDDEFDGTALADHWYPNRWFATECSVGASSGEEQIYTPRASNVSVSGGYLRLTARRENYRCAEWDATAAYTSGWIQSGGSRDAGGNDAAPGFTCTVGCFVETRIRMPAGAVTFPAVWLMPLDVADGKRQYASRPEIDVVEFYRSWTSWEHHVHLSCGGLEVDRGRSHADVDASEGFHTVAVWWRTPERIEWYVDGELTWSYTGCGVPAPDQEMYLILNQAVGGAAPSHSGSEPFPKTMMVDYVRAWSS